MLTWRRRPGPEIPAHTELFTQVTIAAPHPKQAGLKSEDRPFLTLLGWFSFLSLFHQGTQEAAADQKLTHVTSVSAALTRVAVELAVGGHTSVLPLCPSCPSSHTSRAAFFALQLKEDKTEASSPAWPAPNPPIIPIIVSQSHGQPSSRSRKPASPLSVNST